MADFTFLFNRKGAIYPLDLAAPTLSSLNGANLIRQHQTTPPTTTVGTTTASTAATLSCKLAHLNNEWPFNNLLDATLVHLCCKVIVNMPPKELDQITDNIPAELFVPLFKATLYPVRDSAIDVSVCAKLSSSWFFIIKARLKLNI